MTVTADFAAEMGALRRTVRTVDGGRLIMRVLLRLTGVALVLACLGLWLAPGASWESDIMLFKLILSVMTGLTGICLLQTSVAPKQPEIEIDTKIGELRLIRPSRAGRGEVLHSCSFADLELAELRGQHLRLWEKGSRLIAEIAITNGRAENEMLAGLRAAGKLA